MKLCSFVNCKSRSAATITPVIRMWAKGIPRSQCPPAHVYVHELTMCENCAQTAKVNDVMTDKRWTEICATFASKGAAPPDRDSLVLVFSRPRPRPLQ